MFPGCGIEPDPGVTDRHHHIHLTAVLRASDEVTSPALNLRPDRRGHDRRLRDGLRTSKTLPLFLHPAQLAGASLLYCATKAAVLFAFTRCTPRAVRNCHQGCLTDSQFHLLRLVNLNAHGNLWGSRTQSMVGLTDGNKAAPWMSRTKHLEFETGMGKGRAGDRQLDFWGRQLF